MPANLIVIRDDRLLPDISAGEFEYEFNFPHLLDWSERESALHILLLDGRAEELKAIGYFKINEVIETDDRDVYIGDPNVSMYFSRSSSGQPNWSSPLEVNPLAPMTILETSESQIFDFLGQMEQSAPRKIGSIEYKTLSFLSSNLKSRYSSSAEAELDAEFFLRRTFTFDEVYYRAYDQDSSSAFQSLAKASVARLSEMDLIELTGPGLGLPRVDANLHGFRESDFLARGFGIGKTQDAEGNRTKLERAEAQHQRILEELFLALTEHNYEPKYSSSIDLGIVLPNLKYIFEVKSSTISNFQSQLLTGLMQLLSYAFSFKSDNETAVIKVLVLEKPQGQAINLAEIQEFSQFVGCELFIWDPETPTQNRFAGLRSIMSKGI